MKLPEEIEVEMSKYGIPEASVEVIVRDCAKDGYNAAIEFGFLPDEARAIELHQLIRYGLEPK